VYLILLARDVLSFTPSLDDDGARRLFLVQNKRVAIACDLLSVICRKEKK
jgi:hypothetical protein